MRKRLLIIRGAIAASALVLAGCTNYYKVTDTTSGRAYYTTKVDRERRTAVVRFKDARSGSEITLPSSEVKSIKKDEYKAAVEGK